MGIVPLPKTISRLMIQPMGESNLIKQFIALVQEAASEAMSGEITVTFQHGAPTGIRKISNEKLQPEIERRNSS
jgi:hypothetical protein